MLSLLGILHLNDFAIIVKSFSHFETSTKLGATLSLTQVSLPSLGFTHFEEKLLSTSCTEPWETSQEEVIYLGQLKHCSFKHGYIHPKDQIKTNF